MSFVTDADPGGLPLASLMLIDAECDRFEEAWRGRATRPGVSLE